MTDKRDKSVKHLTSHIVPLPADKCFIDLSEAFELAKLWGVSPQELRNIACAECRQGLPVVALAFSDVQINVKLEPQPDTSKPSFIDSVD